MAQSVEPGVFRDEDRVSITGGLASGQGHAGRNLRWQEPTVHYVAVAFDFPGTGREHQIEVALWAGELPFFQSVDDQRCERHLALASVRFRHAYVMVPIGPLPNV